ncbi:MULTISPECIES: biotin-dependent carboxyltransferase family protein [unclassified Ensifer]|uniref:5-oxoprolinase subunit C family protein n=1 Tax=unclassified Ensifer TaxID=2633371 RepID=UPI00081328C2|nr:MULTISPECIES: biotin-dependent carboxyltransferase family protein [unclassified Ensifer]OCP21243.1 allophanate hydrolase [Ensifer sp. LC384]OCP21826.1 allophanate hydrolase [Ensifer sp. LC54]OCP35794.1 allophanate hydrolase [Ensifer sp. LC163]
MIEVIETGPFNTVQDLGRPGYRKIGVTASGAMDPLGLKLGNLLVGNAPGAAAIEVQTFPFRLRFTGAVVFTVAGADCGAGLDGHPLLALCTYVADKGQVLDLGQPRTGARAYVCVAGGVDVEPVMGSRSTSLRGAFGGNDGRYLRVGDTLSLCAATDGHRARAGISVVDPAFALSDHLPVSDDGSLLIRALPAGEHDLFGNDADRFWTETWKISSKSDRTGYRLSGEPIRPTTPVEMRSHGVVPGVVQVPPGGEPIVQMSDANTAGGYPKIAGVIDADLWRLGQARIGSRLRFVRATHREALDVERAMARFLEDVRVTSAMVTRALNIMA